MSSILITNDGEREGIEYSVLSLPVRHNVEVPPLACAVLPHGLEIEVHGIVVLLPEDGVFMDSSLLISACIVQSGEVVTSVFNMSSERVRVKKGEVISRLVAL